MPAGPGRAGPCCWSGCFCERESGRDVGPADIPAGRAGSEIRSSAGPAMARRPGLALSMSLRWSRWPMVPLLPHPPLICTRRYVPARDVGNGVLVVEETFPSRLGLGGGGRGRTRV
jgi:hypothetical protein